MTTTELTTLIESETAAANYGMPQTIAIVDTPDGRLLLSQAFGGIDTLAGGAVRWRHGLAVKLHPTDTLASLREGEWNDETSLMQAVLHGEDDSRPVKDWDGYQIEAIAKSAGL